MLCWVEQCTLLQLSNTQGDKTSWHRLTLRGLPSRPKIKLIKRSTIDKPCRKWQNYYKKVHWSLCLWRRICGSFFLLLSFSCSQFVHFFRWKHHYLSENIFHSNDDLFPIPLFERNKVSFDEFFMMTWDQENQSEVKKEPQIARQKESQKHKSWD